MGMGAEVAKPTLGGFSDREINDSRDTWDGNEKGTIVFDERRIISSGLGGVQVRRFDV
jgi:hypothetical protein